MYMFFTQSKSQKQAQPESLSTQKPARKSSSPLPTKQIQYSTVIKKKQKEEEIKPPSQKLVNTILLKGRLQRKTRTPSQTKQTSKKITLILTISSISNFSHTLYKRSKQVLYTVNNLLQYSIKLKPNPIRDIPPLYGLEVEASCLGSLKYLNSVSACKTKQEPFKVNQPYQGSRQKS